VDPLKTPPGAVSFDRWTGSKRRSRGWTSLVETMVALKRRPFVFAALLVFFGLYYYRPEDFIKPLAYIPMAKVAGILGFVALLAGMMGADKVKMPKAIKILWLLLLQEALCVPLAIWPGGAFSTVFGRFAKGVVVAMLIGMVVVTVGELRKLLWIQASAVTLVTFLSIAMRNYGEQGRLAGIQNSILSNPNDLAINIAITFPLALALMLRVRGARKLIWAVGLGFLCLGVVLTQSRSGLLALITSIVVSVWEYGIRGKRRHLVVITIVVFVLSFGAAVTNARYRARVESIVNGSVEGQGSGGAGSIKARKELLKLSAMTALTHPLFGVGPGCFPLMADAGWKVAHNAYTELAAEAGIPALVLFLAALAAAFKNIVEIRKSPHYLNDPEFKLFTQALWAGLAAYLIGSFFASTEYNLYPYYVIGYTCAMVRIASVPLVAKNEKQKGRAFRSFGYAGGKLQTLGSR
jgi:O-antigen ligase